MFAYGSDFMPNREDPGQHVTPPKIRIGQPWSRAPFKQVVCAGPREEDLFSPTFFIGTLNVESAIHP